MYMHANVNVFTYIYIYMRMHDSACLTYVSITCIVYWGKEEIFKLLYIANRLRWKSFAVFMVFADQSVTIKF